MGTGAFFIFDNQKQTHVDNKVECSFTNLCWHLIVGNCKENLLQIDVTFFSQACS